MKQKKHKKGQIVNHPNFATQQFLKQVLAGMFVLSVTVALAFAQSGVTNIVNGTSTNISNYELTGSFNSLQILGGGIVTNTATAGDGGTFIGYASASSSSNSVLVSGPNSLLDQLAGG